MTSEGSKGLGYVFYAKMLEHSEKIAQVDALTSEADTYGGLLKRSVRTALKLQERGIKSGDIVMICSLNYKDSYVPHFAAQFLGAITSALDPTLSLADVIHLLKQVPPKIIFIMPSCTDLIETALKEIGLTDIEIVVFGPTKTHHTPFGEFLKEDPSEESFRPVEVTDRDKTALILFSSGTTGLPKGICVSNLKFFQSMQILNYLGLAYVVNLTTTSLYWISAHYISTLSVLNGFTRILVPKFQSTDVWNAVRKHLPTLIFATPLQLVELANKKMEMGAERTSLRHLATAGVSVFPSHVDVLAKAFPEAVLLVAYGQTETCITSAFNLNHPEDVELLHKKPTAAGRIFSEYIHKVVDVETGQCLGANQPGELYIKRECIMFNGYYNMDSSQVFEDDWYKTGDIVYLDEDGCMYVVDRLKEMLKFQGWHVAPAVVEQVVCAHPAVEKCIVVGVPHEIDGDHPMAVVVLKKTFDDHVVTPEEIQEFVEQRVDDRKKLRGGVRIVQSFPTLLTGKVNRRRVRDLALSGEL